MTQRPDSAAPRIFLVVCFLLILGIIHQITPHREIRTSIAPSIPQILASGFSSWMAQGYWLALETTPTRNTLPNVMQKVDLVLSLDPDNRFYRTNAAAILAYDLPAEMQMSSDEMNDSIRNALRILDDGTRICPEEAAFYYYEIGKIQLLKLHDPSKARHYFQLASEIQ